MKNNEDTKQLNQQPKKEKKEAKQKIHGVKLGVYFTFLMTGIIIIVTAWLAVITIWYVKNLTGAYDGDATSSKMAMAQALFQTLTNDEEKNDYNSTEQMIDVLSGNNDINLMSYVYIKDLKDNKFVKFEGKPLPDSTFNETSGLDGNIQRFARETKTGNHKMFYGFPAVSKINEYSTSFFKDLTRALLSIIIIGILISFYISKILSKPLNELRLAAKKFTKGDFSARIESTNFEEINDLIETYNIMAKQLDDLYKSLETKVQQRTIALKEANSKLKETQAMMVHSEKMRSLGELVAGIAHEINNPINFIYGNIMILQNYSDDLLRLIDLYGENDVNLPEDMKSKIKQLREEIDIDFLRGDIKDLIGSCVEGTQRTKNIILDLKNFSRMEAMVLTQFDIPKEIDTTLNILNNKLKNRITIVKNYNEDVPKIEAYGGQLNQVFMNIIDNAQDAMGETGTLTINLKKADSNVIIEFIDTGSGIAPENIQKVFEPFFTTKVVGKGTGLGMSISYRVIKDHNGDIKVSSEVGKGTKFTITLPINHVEGKKQEEANS